MGINWCNISILRSGTHTRIHTIHRLLLMTLLRTLVHHHWCTSTRTVRESICSHWRGVTCSWWHKRSLLRGVHHLRARCHSLSCQEATSWIWHHDRTHWTLLGYELVTLRQRPKLWLHRWTTWVLHHAGVVQLRILIHRRRICHVDVLHAGRCVRLSRVRRHHSVIIMPVETWVRTMSKLVSMKIDRWRTR